MPTYVSKQGVNDLEKELEHRKKVVRVQIGEKIGAALEFGDLKENAEYHAAKEKQSFVEGRIRDIEGKLSQCQVIDISKINNEGKVIFGSTVTLLNADTEEQVIYQIVGEDEANIKENKISVISPIARAMIGKQVDDVIEVRTPEGVTEYEIVEVVHL